MSGPAKAIILCSTLLWALSASPGFAHGPAPAPLEITSVSEGVVSPDLVRTSIGLALALDDGSYAYGCPSQWGDVETAFVAALQDRSLITTVGGGALYLSIDGGCAFQPASLPYEDAKVRNVTAFNEHIYGIAALDEGGMVFKLNEFQELSIEVEIPQRPDSIVIGQSLDETHVMFVAAARPEAALWMATLNSAGSWDWAQIADSDDLGTPDFIALRPLGADGRLWLRLSEEGKRSLAFAEESEGFLEWVVAGEQFSLLLGPIWNDKGWIAALDGKVAKWSGSEWVSGEEVNWTCLQNMKGRAFACTLKQIFEISEEVELFEPTAALTPVFHMNQIGPPSELCSLEYEESISCQTDWLHFGGESGLVGKEPARSPDGLRQETRPEPSGGCHSQGAPVDLELIGAVILFFLINRVGRRLRRAGH